MNKVFKVIWSHATQTWAVVSELTKSRGKASVQTDERQSPRAQSTMRFKLSAQGLTSILITAALFGSGSAFASSPWTQGNNSHDIAHRPTVVIGEGYGEDGQEGAAANAGAHGSTTTGKEGALHSISIGGGANVVTQYGTAMGYHATVGTGIVHSNQKNHKENKAAAGSVAIGAYAHTMGKKDKHTGASATQFLFDKNLKFAGAATGDSVTVFSIGNKNGKYTFRQLQNVAAGDISAGSTDGINGSQLYQTIKYFQDKGTWHYVSIQGKNKDAGSNYNNDGAKSAFSIAIGDSATTTAGAENATAVGTKATAKHTGAVAVGSSANAGGQKSVAIGFQANATGGESGGKQIATAVGAYSQANKAASTAYGAYATANGNFSVAIGNDANATGVGTTAIGQGALATIKNPNDLNYAYSTALGQNAKATGRSSNALGRLANATGYYSTSIGANTLSDGAGAIAIGGAMKAQDGAKALSASTIAIGVEANASADAAIAFGKGAHSAGSGTIAMGFNANVAKVSDAVAIGTSTNIISSNAVAIGKSANVTGYAGVAIGADTIASKPSALALGASAHATHDKSVALGWNATTDTATGTNQATVNHITYQGFAGRSPIATVSVGRGGEERTITNVAAGRVTAASTDAINGSQLYMVADRLSKTTDIQGTQAGNVTLPKGAKGEYFVNGTTVVKAVNSAGWKIQGKGADKGLVKPSNTVNFVDGTATTAEVGGANGAYTVKYNVNAGNGLHIGNNNKLEANVSDIQAGTNVKVQKQNGVVTISATDTNTHASVISSDQSVTVTKTDVNGTPQYDLKVKAAAGTSITHGDNVAVEGTAQTGYTIHADSAEVVQGAGTKVTSTKTGRKTTYTVAANVTSITGGKDVSVTNNNGAYTISANNTQASVEADADRPISVTPSENANGTKKYKLDIKTGSGLKVEGGKLVANGTTLTAGKNVSITGTADKGYTINANNSVVTAEDDTVKVTSTTADGTTTYKVKGNYAAGKGVTINGNTISAAVAGIEAGDNVHINKNDSTGVYTIAAENAIVAQGTGTTVSKQKTGNNTTYTVNANVADIQGGQNVTVNKLANGVYEISATDKNTQASVKAAENSPISVTEGTNNANGTKQYVVNVSTGKGLKVEGGKLVANGTTLHAGKNVSISGDADQGYTINASSNGSVVSVLDNTLSLTSEKGADGTTTYKLKGGYVGGDGVTVEGNVIKANVTHIEAGKNVQVNKKANGVYEVSANNTQSTVEAAANRPISVTATDNSDGTKKYTVDVKTGKGLKVEDGKLVANGTTLTAGKNVSISGDADTGYTVNANSSVVEAADQTVTVTSTKNGDTTTYKVKGNYVAGKGVTIDGNSISANVTDIKQGENVQVSKDDATGAYTIAADKAVVAQGTGTTVTRSTVGKTTTYTVKANVSKVQAGQNVTVADKGDGVFEISATDTNTQASVEAAAGSPISVTESAQNNSNGTKKYMLNVSTGAGLKVENGKLVANGTTITAGKNVSVTGSANAGYTINANDTVVAAGNNIKTVRKTTALDGTTTYTIDAADYRAGNGVTIQGSKESGYTIAANISDVIAGKNVQVSKAANGSVTVSATDTNTQATVEAADTTVTVDSSEKNTDGTTKYKVKSNFTAGSGISINGNVISAAGTSITAGDNVVVSKTNDGGYSITANGSIVVAGDGVTVSTSKNGSNTTYTVKANVAEINGGNVDVKKNNGVYTLNVPTTDLTVNADGKVESPAGNNGQKFANASIIVKTINNVSFKTAVGRDNSDFTDQASSNAKAVKAGDTLTFKSGKNLKVKQEGSSFTYATEDNVSFNKVNASTVVIGDKANNTTLTSTASGLSVGGDKITNVADGDISEASTDAINGSQLHETNQNVTKVNNNLTNLTTKVGLGLNFQGNDSQKINKKLGETLTIKGGNAGTAVSDKNTYVMKDDAGNLVIKIAEVPEFKGLTLKDGGNEVRFTTNAKGLSLAKGNNQNATISGVAPAELSKNSTEAVNGSQLYATNRNLTNLTTEVAKGWNVTAEMVAGSTGKVTNGKPAQVAMGDTVTLKAGNNIEINQTGKELAIATSMTPTFTNVTTGDTVLADNGLTIKNGPSVQKTGINAGGKVITNVAPGVNGTDAVNLEQLNATLSTSVATTTLSVEHGKVKDVDDANKGKLVNATMIAQTINNVSWAVAENGASKGDVKAGTKVSFNNGSGTTATVSEKNGTVNVAYNVNTTTITARPNGTVQAGKTGDNFATATEVANAINRAAFNVTIARDDAEFNDLANTQANKQIKAGETLAFKAGKNLKIKQDGTNITYATQDNVTFSTVNATTLIVGKPGKNGEKGVAIDGTNGTIGINGKDGASANINVEKGTTTVNATDNGKPIDRVKYVDSKQKTREVATLDDGLKFKGDNAVVINRTLGSLLNIVGGAPTNAANLTANNIGVVGNADGNLTIKLNKDVDLGATGSLKLGDTLLNNTGLTITGGPSVQKSGIDAANTIISNVSAGKKGTDAVNVSQLNSTVAIAVANTSLAVENGKVKDVDDANKGKLVNATMIAQTINNVSWSVFENTTEKKAIKAGDKVAFTNGNGTLAKVNVDKNGTVNVSYDVDTVKLTDNNGKVNANGTVTAPTNDKQIATAQEVAKAINSAGWNITAAAADGGKLDGKATNELINPGETVKLQAGKNLKIKQDGNNFTYATQDNVTFSTVNATTLIVGKPGKNGEKGVAIDGTNGTIGINGKDGASANIKVEKGTTTVNATDQGKPIDRVKYVDSKQKTREVATLDDGLKFKGDNAVVINRTLGSLLNIVGGAKEPNLTANNIGVVGNADGSLTIKLNKDVDLGATGSLKLGDTLLNNTGLTITGGPSVQKSGIDAANTIISNVSAGKKGTDAVNVSQLNSTVAIAVANTSLAVENGKVKEVDDANKGKLVNATMIAQTINNVSWSVFENTTEKKAIKAGDKVAFTNGNGTLAKVNVDKNGTVNVSYDVDTVKLTGENGKVNANGTVTAPTNAKQIATAQEVAKAINSAGWNITAAAADGGKLDGKATNELINPGETVKLQAGKNLKIKQDGNNFTYATQDNVTFSTVNATTLIVGKPGKNGEKGVAIDGTNGTIGLNGKDGANSSLTVANGNTTVAERDGGKKITRVTYTDKDKNGNTITREIATLDDGLKFKGDNAVVINRTLGSLLNIVGGAKEANLTANNIGVVGNATTGALNIKLNKDLNLTNNGSVVIGNTTLNNNGLTIKDGPSVTQVGINAGGKVITHVAKGVNGTDAVNVAQLNSTVATAVANTTLTVKNGKVQTPTEGNKLVNATTVANAINDSGWHVKAAENGGSVTGEKDELVNPGETVQLQAGKNIQVHQEGANFTFSLKDNLAIGEKGEKGENGKPGVDGRIGVNGKDGSSVVINGKDGSIGLTGKAGADGKHASTNLTVANGTTTVADRDGGKNITRVTYTDKDKNGKDITREIATLDDGLKFKGDNAVVINRTLGSLLNIVGGAKNEANLTANNIGVVGDASGTMNIKLNKDIDLGSNGSVTIGNSTLNDRGLVLKDGPSITKEGINAGKHKVTDVEDGNIAPRSKDAINGGQLYSVTKGINDTIAKGWNVHTQAVAGSNGVVKNSTKANVALGDTVNIQAGNNIEITQNGKDIAIATSSTPTFTNITTNDVMVGKAGKDGKDGVDGTVNVNGKNGSSVVINGKDGSIGLTGAKGADGKDGASANIKVENGVKGLDGNDGKDGESKTRIVYEKPNGQKETVATMNDGLIFVGDSGKESKRKLGEKVTVRGGQTDTSKLAHKPNVGIVSDGNGNLDVKLSKKLDLEKDGSLTIGNTTVNNDGVTIKGGASITSGGINAGNKVISNVAPGVKNTDAVNVAQLKGVVNNANNRINHLDNKVNKNRRRADAGTAAVAAMANIPQASLPGKSGVGIGIGHRGSQTAVAIGYSRLSDNAKHIIKFSAGMDSQHTGTVGAGYMYQW